jgi:3-hydroxyacyl-[acyl-carrier-protein] dehydratase
MDTVDDISEILKYLPHRYPFLMVDRVIAFEPNKSLTAFKNVTYNEPIFTGHFPQSPVFPGVLILEALAQASALLAFKSMGGYPSERTLYLLAGIDKARFRRQVVPGDRLTFEVSVLREKRGIWKFEASASVDGALACTAEVMVARNELEEE